MSKRIKKLLISIFCFISAFYLFAITYYPWEFEDRNVNLCEDEKTKQFYEDQLKKTFNDDSIEIDEIFKVDLSNLVDVNIYRVYLRKYSKQHFRAMTVPLGRNTGYCILDGNNQLINLWKNSKETQKLIKAANLSNRDLNDKKAFLSFIYDACFADKDEPLWHKIEIIDSFEDMHARQLDKWITMKYKDLKDAIKITDTQIEFYAFYGYSSPAFIKVVLTFDEENGVIMQVTILEKRIENTILPW